MENIESKIKEIIENNDVVLFMKGTPDFPQCGFSANTVAILNYFNVDFKSFNVLEDQELRQGVKTFSDWPTIPQIYLKEEFIGGFDILKEMAETGDLVKLLDKKSIVYKIEG